MFINALWTTLIGASMAVASPVFAQDKPMKLESDVQLLKVAEQEGAEPQLLEAKNVVPGDRLVFTTRFRNQGSTPVDDFVIVNPVPADVELTDEPATGAQVSVDGARSWGRLTDLSIIELSGEQRPATIHDITHLRWEFSRVPAGDAGRVQFSAQVR